MSAWGSAWGNSWGNSWGSVTVDPNAMQGSAAFSFSASLQVAQGQMQGSASFSITGQLESGLSGLVLLGGAPGKKSYHDDKSSYWHRLLSPPTQSKLEAIEPEIAEAIEAQAVQVVEQKTQIDAQAEMQRAMNDLGFAYREAYKEIYLELIAEMRQAQEDEQIAAVVAALL